MWWLIKSNDNDNDKSETGSSNKENYKTNSYNSDKKYIRGNDDNDNKEQDDDIENYIYDCKGEGITSNPRSSR